MHFTARSAWGARPQDAITTASISGSDQLLCAHQTTLCRQVLANSSTRSVLPDRKQLPDGAVCRLRNVLRMECGPMLRLRPVRQWQVPSCSRCQDLLFFLYLKADLLNYFLPSDVLVWLPRRVQAHRLPSCAVVSACGRCVHSQQKSSISAWNASPQRAKALPVFALHGAVLSRLRDDSCGSTS